MSEPAQIKETPALMVKLLRQLSSLLHNEIALARADISQRLSRAGVGLGFLAGAFLLALVALQVLAGAAVAGLVHGGMAIWAAALSVGVIVLLIAGIFAAIGKARMSADALKPQRSLDNLERDAEAVKEASHVRS